MNGRVLFHVQHLLGIGHLRRAALIAAALEAAGFEVVLVSGGMPMPGLPVPAVQLPPVQAGPGGFGDLRDADGRPVDAAWQARRRDSLLRLFAEMRPDILMIEAFPFGRRAFRFELLPLLEAARSRPSPPLVVCSVRDIVQRRTPERDAETLALLDRLFDLVLVHGDPALVPLSRSFPPAAAIGDRLHHTGLVVDPAACVLRPTARDGILVSAGGGAAGQVLLRVAAEASALAAGRFGPWRLVCGPNLPEPDRAAIASLAAGRAAVDGVRTDMPALAATASVAVGQAGYNSVAELLAARTPAVLVPYTDGGETEQAERAATMAGRGLAIDLPEHDLDAPALLDAVMRAAALRPVHAVDLDGAAATVRILADAVGLDGRDPKGL
ncbi:MAG: glycosyltransferase family protein [Alphaproteobacteria bacterium]